MRVILLFAVLLLSTFHHHLNASTTTVYKYIDANGVLHLTNRPPPEEQPLLYTRSYTVRRYAPPPSAPLLPDSFSPSQFLALQGLNTFALPAVGKNTEKTRPYDDTIQHIAAQYQLPAELLHAVIKVESNYNPNAVSPKGATGLMQLMPGTAARYGVTDRTDPLDNMTGGAKYLRDLLHLFDNDLTLALAAYNAGENAVIKHNRQIPPYRETQNYVKKVLALYQNR
ncbi:lytic transglycosylase domain-containing protein [Thioflexithrix psekupsensis]|uniref:Lytic transglycosylase n=1 Tax=Thioflexithrix psekupsensis TaxID=1570016 RepID=A0A251X5U6_9GAMM|nr:lytic transglycosylase domain-containing protein [Thioflexithrix psekupsensis]OUD12522.1 hypothetical protein TPSD3_15645 [Thioflexithrix psekupsensis]